MISRSKIVEAVPHMSLFIVGLILSGVMHPALFVVYLLVFLGANIWFWRSICTNCYSYGNKGCPSGYGMISSRLFRKAREPNFKRAFKRNIWVIVLQFTLPLIFSIPILIFPSISPFSSWSGNMVFYVASGVLMVVFSLIAFVWIPVHSRNKACDSCPQSRDCPWIKK